MNRTYYEALDETLYSARLKNGLTVAVVPRQGFTKKLAYFVTDYGSIHTSFCLEGKEHRVPDGIAHYLEHTLVGDEVQVVINTVSYTAPTNSTNGSYTFTANICNADGEVLYTTSEYVLTISYEVDTTPIAFTFRNLSFIGRVEGTLPVAKGYAYMALTDDVQTSFALSLNSTEKFHLQGHPYIALKVNATSNTSYITLNGVDYSLGSAIQGETVLVIDTVTGKVYANGSEVQGITLSDVVKERIVSLGMKFAAQEANVYYMAFFATLQEAKDYTGTSEVLQETVNAIQALSLKCAYADAKTQEEAMA